MNILILNGGDDTGAVAIRIKQAFDRHEPEWNVRCVRMTDNYAHHPQDLTWGSGELIRELYEKAHVIHWMERVQHAFGIGGKPTVIHHHGEIYRDELAGLQGQANLLQAVQLVSTVDLLSVDPGATEWLPTPYNLDWLTSQRAQRPPGPPIIFHSPTVEFRKGTAELEAALAEMREASVAFDYRKVMYQEQESVIAQKGHADIVFDNLFGYGLNGIEAMAMGIPVVGGLVPSRYANDQVRADIMKHIGYVPFYEVSRETIRDGLETMLGSERIRQHWGQVGIEYANTFHDEVKTVARLKAIYQRAREQRTAS